MSDEAAAPYCQRIPEREQDQSWQLILPSGDRFMRGKAGIELLKILRATRWVGRALELLRLHWLTGAGYWVLHNVRAPLGRLMSKKPGPRRWP